MFTLSNQPGQKYGSTCGSDTSGTSPEARPTWDATPYTQSSEDTSRARPFPARPTSSEEFLFWGQAPPWAGELPRGDTGIRAARDRLVHGVSQLDAPRACLLGPDEIPRNSTNIFGRKNPFLRTERGPMTTAQLLRLTLNTIGWETCIFQDKARCCDLGEGTGRDTQAIRKIF